MWRVVRSSSSLATVWVKHNGSQAIQVSTAGCEDISDLVKAIKNELPKQLAAFDSSQLTVHKSLTDAPLRPGLAMEELSQFVDPNTKESPLFVKTQEIMTATQKTIFVQDVVDEHDPMDSFTEFVVENDADLRQIFRGCGSALYQLSNPQVRVTKMKQLIDGESYNVYSRYPQFFVDKVPWQRMEDQTSTTQKTIFVQDIDEKFRSIDSFTVVVVCNEADLQQIFGERGTALYQLSHPKKAITKFKQLIDGEKYNVYSRYEQSFRRKPRWQPMKDQAMEQETFLAMKRYLVRQLGDSVVDMPTEILGSDGKTIVQEWDAVFGDGDVLYLCKAKHNKTLKQVNKLPHRIKKFRQLQADAQSEFHGAKQLVGVLCGALFPEIIRQTALLHQFICVYPSGHRYDVQKPPTEFIIER
jgi:hypothetical protein